MMTTLPKENLRVITFDTHIGNSDNKPVPGTKRTHNLVFNCTQITDEEIETLIENGMWDFDNRVIDIPTSILENLRDKKPYNDEEDK